MKSLFRQKRKLNLAWTILLFLGISLAILLVSLYLQWGSTLKLLRNFAHDPRLLILNLFPIMAVLGLLYALLGNLFFAGSVTALVFHLLSLIDLIKVECRKDPLVPPDFALLGEAMQATGEYQLDLHPGRIALIIAFALALLLLGLILKRRPKILSRILLALAAVGCMTGAMLTVYPSGDLYLGVIKKVPGLTYTNVPKVFGETGFVYCFLHNVGMYEVEKPTGYEKTEAEAWASQPDAPGGEPVKANVIFVQCEAFSSVFDEDVFSYAPEDNPMFLFHQVEQGPRAVSGRIVVSNFGAGTANTEFEVLTGIDLTMYGEDLDVHPDLGDLILAVSKVDGIKRIRLGSLEPRVVTPAFIEKIRQTGKLCPHFHLALQSGCARTLKAMNRRYTPEEFEKAVRMLRDYDPDAAITTDIIVGFPGETDQDHQEALDFVRRIGFAECHVFRYSQMEGTAAAKRADQVDGNVKKVRSDQMLAAAAEGTEAFMKRMQGKVFDVILEQKESGYWTGYTQNYVKIGVQMPDDSDHHGEEIRVRADGYLDISNANHEASGLEKIMKGERQL